MTVPAFGLTPNVGPSDPGAIGPGQLWLDTTSPSAPVLKIRSDDDTSWNPVGGGGGGSPAPLSAYLVSATAVPGDGASHPLTWTLAEGPAVLVINSPGISMTTPAGQILCLNALVQPLAAQAGKLMQMSFSIAPGPVVPMDADLSGNPPYNTSSLTQMFSAASTMECQVAHNTGSPVDFSGYVLVQPLA